MNNNRSFFFILILIVPSTMIFFTGAGFPEDPLHQLIRDGNLALVKKMVSWGADLEALTDYGQTSLHCATRADSASIVLYLLEQGANVDAVDEGGNTSAICAVSFDRTIDIGVLDALLSYKADVNAKNNKGESAIDLVLIAHKRANVNSGISTDQDKRFIEENKVRPLKIRRLLEKGARVTKEQFQSLLLPDQEVVCKRRRVVELALESMNEKYVPEDLVKEALSMLYGDRRYNDQLKQWCEILDTQK